MISVIVPVHNASDSLASTLDSIRTQTYSELEVILVDDGSDDGSGGMCDEYAGKDSRFKVFHQENRGVASARNTGLVAARGEWICFVDADDYLHPEALGILLKGTNKGSKLSSAGFRYGYTEEGNPFQEYQHISEAVEIKSLSDSECKQMLFSRDPREATWGMTVWNKLYARDLIGVLRFEDYQVSEDALFNFQVFSRLERLSYVNAITYSYTQRPQSLSHARIGEMSLEQLRVYHRMLYCQPHGQLSDTIMTEGLILSKLYRILWTSFYHTSNSYILRKEWEKESRSLIRNTRNSFWGNPYIPMMEKAAFILFSSCPFLMKLYMKWKGN